MAAPPARLPTRGQRLPAALSRLSHWTACRPRRGDPSLRRFASKQAFTKLFEGVHSGRGRHACSRGPRRPAPTVGRGSCRVGTAQCSPGVPPTPPSPGRGETTAWETLGPQTQPSPRGTLTMSLPESEDTEEVEEPDDSSWGLGRDRVRRWL